MKICFEKREKLHPVWKLLNPVICIILALLACTVLLLAIVNMAMTNGTRASPMSALVLSITRLRINEGPSGVRIGIKNSIIPKSEGRKNFKNRFAEIFLDSIALPCPFYVIFIGSTV